MESPAGKPRRNQYLNGKTVVITGASSGAGRAAALEFARYGSNLVLAARRIDALEEVVLECEELGASAMAVKTDVTDAASVKALASAASEYNGVIDVWVNNAGVLALGEFDKTPIEVHDQVIRTNLLGYMHGAHAVLPYFKKQGYGVLINNISVGGWFPTPYGGGYTASKFGLRGFSESLRGELLKWPGIRVCDLFPAFLDTPGVQHAANYTGVALRPAPPVFDPQNLAKKMVSLALNPAQRYRSDPAAQLLRFAHVFFPGLTRRITSRVINMYFNTAEPIETTNGNIFEPVEYGTSIHGGWNITTRKERVIKRSLLVSGLVIGLIALNRLGKRS